MSTAKTPCVCQYMLSPRLFYQVQHVNVTEETAHDVFQIFSCHGNTFENSCQTSCQLQYILLGLCITAPERFIGRKNHLATCLELVVCTFWWQRTLRAYWLLCGMRVLFLHFPEGFYQAFKHCSSLLPVISQWHCWHIVRHYNYLSSRKTNSGIWRLYSRDLYNTVQFISTWCMINKKELGIR